MKKIVKKVIIFLGLDNLSKAKRKGLTMGVDSSVASSVYFGTEPYLIKIGDKVRVTQNVKFITHDGGMWVLRNLGIAPDADKFGTIEIGNNVNIGWNAIIMPNVTIGDNVIVGAGSIVTKDIPSNTVWAGVPAKKISTIEEYFKKNRNQYDYSKSFNSKEKEKYLKEKYFKP